MVALHSLKSWGLLLGVSLTLGLYLLPGVAEVAAQDAADAPRAAGGVLPPGFSKISGRHIDVITDMPLSPELRELPAVFDAAMAQWCQVFDISVASVADWRVESFVMLERERFIRAGFLPEPISHFAYGFQYGDRLWVTEQPSAYYRRHLLLHEGTHWIMTHKYGRQGAPWLMEGLAEWLGTHRWDGSQLTMGIIPSSRDEVPYWGRTNLIQDQLEQGLAPSLENVLRYSDSAHQQTEAYAWSWAAVVFLKHHPDSATTFAKLLGQPIQSRDDSNRWLFRQLITKWPQLRLEWNAMLSELDYGFDPARGMLTLSRQPQALSGPRTITIDATSGWQASGIEVASGAKFTIHAEGEFVVAREPQPWRCMADGVTLEYYRGLPLGRLLMTVVAPISKEPDYSLPISILSVGGGGEFSVPTAGELHFRINESIGGLADNSGQLTLAIRP